jgi:mono/diheme cytochrome c family protein/plastocyanin
MAMRSGTFSHMLLAVVAVGLSALTLYQFVLRPKSNSPRVIDIVASKPEHGGFHPSSIIVDAGETVTLRITSTDVVHGLAIGPGLDINLGYAAPGQVQEVSFSIKEPGKYTFYCVTWCSSDHWRMRGVIDVRNPDDRDYVPIVITDPVIAALAEAGVDIDASRTDTMNSSAMDTGSTLNGIPSAIRGEIFAKTLIVPAELRDKVWQRSHTPVQGMALLLSRNPTATSDLLADATAYLWLNEVDDGARASAATYYAQNCSACHGANGAGDGIAAPDLAESPAAFTDTNYLFEMRGDVLYAKIRRGGMGTNMPNFGTLITREETWALVDYLWTLGFGPIPGTAR